MFPFFLSQAEKRASKLIAGVFPPQCLNGIGHARHDRNAMTVIDPFDMRLGENAIPAPNDGRNGGLPSDRDCAEHKNPPCLYQ